MKLEVFDPPMCCSSGVCGTNVDTKLVTFSSDLEWLKKQGIDVIRYGLAFEPKKFVEIEIVKKTLEKEGNDSLPLIVVDHEVVYKSGYPDRKKLAEICGIEWKAEYIKEEIVYDSSSECGPDCDCHNSTVSQSTKKTIFIIVLLIIIGILAIKSCCKAGAEPAKQNARVSSGILGQSLESINQLKSRQNVSFVLVPSQGNGSVNDSAKSNVLSSQKILNNKNITVNLYTLKSSSVDYASLASKYTLPAIIVFNNGQMKSVVSAEEINQTRLLQAYVAAMQAGCASSCPCNK
jgi:hypothetical protein